MYSQVTLELYFCCCPLYSYRESIPKSYSSIIRAFLDLSKLGYSIPETNLEITPEVTPEVLHIILKYCYQLLQNNW